MGREKIPPKITHNGLIGDIYEHPAYGTMTFSRMQTNGTELFGSSIKHHNIISLKIHNANLERGLKNDFYHDKDLIIEVQMSYSQFAEAITSMNQSPGIPVTIDYIRGQGDIPQCTMENKRAQINEEFKNHVESINSRANGLIAQVEELFQTKKSFTKADKEAVMSNLRKLKQDLGPNMTFIQSSFDEQMVKTVTEAKGEIEAFMQNKMYAIANNALIENGENIDMKESLSLEDINNPVSIDE